MQALLGPQLSAEMNLAAQILILAGLWLGATLARRRRFRRHHSTQTAVVGANLLFILLLMIPSFYSYVIAGHTTTSPIARLMIAHGTLGLVVELTGIYLVLHERTGLMPRRLRVRNFKLTMRALLGLWTLTTVLGVGIYYAGYLAPSRTAATEPVVRRLQAVDDASPALRTFTDEPHSQARRPLDIVSAALGHVVLLEGPPPLLGAEIATGQLAAVGGAELPGKRVQQSAREGIGLFSRLVRRVPSGSQADGHDGAADGATHPPGVRYAAAKPGGDPRYDVGMDPQALGDGQQHALRAVKAAIP